MEQIIPQINSEQQCPSSFVSSCDLKPSLQVDPLEHAWVTQVTPPFIAHEHLVHSSFCQVSPT